MGEAQEAAGWSKIQTNLEDEVDGASKIRSLVSSFSQPHKSFNRVFIEVRSTRKYFSHQSKRPVEGIARALILV